VRFLGASAAGTGRFRPLPRGSRGPAAAVSERRGAHETPGRRRHSGMPSAGPAEGGPPHPDARPRSRDAPGAGLLPGAPRPKGRLLRPGTHGSRTGGPTGDGRRGMTPAELLAEWIDAERATMATEGWAACGTADEIERVRAALSAASRWRGYGMDARGPEGFVHEQSGGLTRHRRHGRPPRSAAPPPRDLPGPLANQDPASGVVFQISIGALWLSGPAGARVKADRTRRAVQPRHSQTRHCGRQGKKGNPMRRTLCAPALRGRPPARGALGVGPGANPADNPEGLEIPLALRAEAVKARGCALPEGVYTVSARHPPLVESVGHKTTPYGRSQATPVEAEASTGRES